MNDSSRSEELEARVEYRLDFEGPQPGVWAACARWFLFRRLAFSARLHGRRVKIIPKELIYADRSLWADLDDYTSRTPKHKKAGREQKKPDLMTKLPRIWDLFPFILPKEIRERVYEPAYNDLLHLHVLAQKYKGEGEKKWLAFCFGLKTVGLIFGSLKAATGARCWAIIEKVLPEWIRHLWSK